ncbi:receptor-like protein EIX1 [Eucalyptus grandis]|uniref:receptor-like protein EIX1 n=1 Tax=Eucalyptus grandis TaxID=71139 RepID=UPI00192ED04F|nr:receptor-like protein EIX1 [Eucalyptus grandis]
MAARAPVERASGGVRGGWRSARSERRASPESGSGRAAAGRGAEARRWASKARGSGSGVEGLLHRRPGAATVLAVAQRAGFGVRVGGGGAAPTRGGPKEHGGGNFHGTVPQQLGNFTELQVLDLHDDNGDLVIDDTQWVSYLQSLNYLDINGLKIAKARDLMQVADTRGAIAYICRNHTSEMVDGYTSRVTATSALQVEVSGLLSALHHLRRLGKSNDPLILESDCLAMVEAVADPRKIPWEIRFVPRTANSVTDWAAKAQVVDLNLGGNELSGSIPDCWKGFRLSHLTLSFNKLFEVIPSSIGSLYQLSTLHLNGNRLNGELSLALGNCTSLVILDLRENNFSRSILTWFNRRCFLLKIVRLRENSFIDNIPPQLCSLSGLQILDMAVNNFTRTIPPCLGHISGMKNFDQDIPSHLGWDQEPAVEIIKGRYNAYTKENLSHLNWNREHVVEIMKGRYDEYTKTVLQLVVNLDLPSNNLIGPIPKELTLLTGLHGLNLSHNLLFGDIPIGIGDIKSLESLDLANNHLLGTIRKGILVLTFLSHLNLLHNNFTGQISKGNQSQNLDDPSIYAGNPLLCGDLLRRKFPSVEAPQAPNTYHS